MGVYSKRKRGDTNVMHGLTLDLPENIYIVQKDK